MAQEADTNEQQSRCEIGKIRKAEGECLRQGKVHFDGSMLCLRHAELLRFAHRFEAMLGLMFMIDQWLASTDDEADELRVRRIEHQRNEVLEQLRFNRTRIGLTRDELLKDQDETT